MRDLTKLFALAPERLKATPRSDSRQTIIPEVQGRRTSTRLLVQTVVANTNRAVLEWHRDCWCGAIIAVPKSSDKWRQSYAWRLGSAIVG